MAAATGVERTARRAIEGAWRPPRYRLQPRVRRAGPGDRGQQIGRVWVRRRGKDRLDITALDDFAEIHDDDVVGQLRDHAKIVGNEHHPHAGFVSEVAQQRQDLGLDGDVKRCGRFVGDQKARFDRQCHGDHGTLTHAAAEFERVLRKTLRRIADADLAQRFDGEIARLVSRQPAVQADGLHHLVSDRVDRREGSHRLLEDHGDLAAANGTHLAAIGGKPGEIEASPVPVEADFPRTDPPVLGQQPQHGQCQNTLA